MTIRRHIAKVLVLLSGVGVLVYGVTTANPYSATFVSAARVTKNPLDVVVVPVNGATDGITLSFAGNTMLGGAFLPLAQKATTSSLDALFGNASTFLKTDDATIVNLETPVSFENVKTYTTTAGIDALLRAGVDTVSLGGRAFTTGSSASIAGTMATLKQRSMQWLGIGESQSEQKKLVKYTKDDMSFGVFAVSDVSNFEFGIKTRYQYMARVREPDFFETITKASKKVDALAVVVHTVPKTKHSYRDELLARRLIDAGATLVVYYGSSAVFDMETYRGGTIVYSLGDFVTGLGAQKSGLLVQASLSPSGTLTIKEFEVLHTTQGAVSTVIPVRVPNQVSIESPYMRISGSERAVYDGLSVYDKSLTAQGMVAITIDDGYNIDNVKAMIDIFRAKKAPATFFPAAELLAPYASVWKMAASAGIEFGNHTFNHPWITHLSPLELSTELTKAKTAIARIAPYQKVVWFRPPNKDGFTEDMWLPNTHIAVLKNAGLKKVALWSLDSYSDYFLLNDAVDGKFVGEDLARRAEAGDIIILHFNDTDRTALPFLIDGLRAKGLEPVTLSTLIPR
jgi:peptidoglycan/xylan/chitin deacetylase (PgdA/CDA1 family)